MVRDQPIATVDLYPTFLDMLDIQPDPKQHLDGVSIAALLRGECVRLERDSLYWHYPLPEKHFLGGRSSGVIRKGDYKLIEFFDDRTVELYNIVEDVGEDNGLSSAMREKVAELQSDLAAWRTDVGVDPSPPCATVTEQGAEGNAVNRAP